MMKTIGRWQRSLFGAMLTLAVAGVGAQSVPTVKLEGASGRSDFFLEGVVQAVRQTTVAAQAQGRVQSLRVKAGDWVKAGQLLATIDDKETAVGSARSQAQWLQAQAEHRNMQAQYERTRELQQKGFVSKAALDAATMQLQSAQAAQDQARASIQLSGIAKGYTQVTAPYEGWVLQTQVQAGDLAVPGTPLLTIYAPQPLRVVVQMPGTRALAAREASQTTLEIATGASAGASLKPTARQIVPSADPVSQTTEWRWDLAAKDSADLLPGQPVRVHFEGAPAKDATTIWVPQQAVVRRGELTGVYVAQGQGFVLRAVRLGSGKTAAAQEVIAGLRVGEVVATDPVKAAAQR